MEIKEIMALLRYRAALSDGRLKPTPEELKAQCDAWWRVLKDYKALDAQNAVAACYGESKFPPTLAEVKEKLDGIRGERKLIGIGVRPIRMHMGDARPERRMLK